MSNAIVSRIGQINKAGDDLALFLKEFGGLVMLAYLRQSAFRGKFLERHIASGKSAQFPAIGRGPTVFYHQAGDEILGGQIGGNERIINLEGKAIAPVFIDSLDELMAHFDTRGPYASQIGDGLAKLIDQNIGRTIVNAARNATANVTGLEAGTTSNNASYATDGTVLYNGAFDATVTQDLHDVPHDGRYIFFDPTGYALVLRSGKPIDIRYNAGAGVNGTESSGRFEVINDVPVFRTNNMPNANDITNTLQPASRQHDYSVTKGLVTQRDAVGTVFLQDMTMEAQYDMRRQGTLILGKFVTGHGDLRSEGTVELRTADPAG